MQKGSVFSLGMVSKLNLMHKTWSFFGADKDWSIYFSWLLFLDVENTLRWKIRSGRAARYMSSFLSVSLLQNLLFINLPTVSFFRIEWVKPFYAKYCIVHRLFATYSGNILSLNGVGFGFLWDPWILVPNLKWYPKVNEILYINVCISDGFPQRRAHEAICAAVGVLKCLLKAHEIAGKWSQTDTLQALWVYMALLHGLVFLSSKLTSSC
jgi:hypothetical protein